MKENQQKLVEALRSGRYQQGRGELKSRFEDNCFCFWGVVCDVSGLSSWTKSNIGGWNNYMGEAVFPPNAVKDWVGFDCSIGVTIDGHEADLMVHNDNGISFAQLADAIEQQIMKVDVKENQRKVVAALRSEKYKKGQNVLQRDGCFCIWGVVCDVSGLSKWRESPVVKGNFGYGSGTMSPPDEVEQWAGFNLQTRVVIGSVETTLMDHNDDHNRNVTFEQMADAIEQQIINKSE
jgi:hypothetical protein